MGGADEVGWASKSGGGGGAGHRSGSLPGSSAQCALQEGYGTPRQPCVAAAQTNESLGQAFLQVTSPLAADRVLATQPAWVRGAGNAQLPLDG